MTDPLFVAGTFVPLRTDITRVGIVQSGERVTLEHFLFISQYNAQVRALAGRYETRQPVLQVDGPMTRLRPENWRLSVEYTKCTE
jgi:hypothetical protein